MKFLIPSLIRLISNWHYVLNIVFPIYRYSLYSFHEVKNTCGGAF